MRKMMSAVMAGSLLLTGAGAMSAAAGDGVFQPGIYSASAAGMGGDVTVEMEFDENSILSVYAEGAEETPGIGTLALEQLPDAVLDAQSADIDGVAGASVTSSALLTAVQSCIDQAKGEETDADTTEALPVEETADVIVVGGGGAGMAAAASASQNGASVILLEANGILGGSTIRSGGHILVFDDDINASMDRNDEALQAYLDYDAADFGEWGEALLTAQEQISAYLKGDQQGRFDSVELALVDHYLKGSGTDRNGEEVTLDYELCKTAFENADNLNAWLIEGGMELQDTMYNAHGGTPVDGAAGLMQALENMAEENGAEILLQMRATQLLMEDGKAVGVVAEDANGMQHTYHADNGVILATGSFSSNPEMVSEYQTMGSGLSSNVGSTNPATNVGDGILMAQSANAQLRDMGFLCTMLKGYHEGGTSREFGAINGKQQLIVNAEGIRFMSDLKAAGMTTVGGINDQTDGLAYFIGDEKMINALNEETEGFVDDVVSRGGWFFVGDTLEEAAEAAGLDAETVQKTVDQFNEYVDAEEDPEFGRTEFNGKVEEGPFAVVKMENHYHLTFGGLVINTDAQVLDEDGQVIANLYAAGDVTSGFEGAAHQSGDCLTTVLYYGKVAGEQAAGSAS